MEDIRSVTMGFNSHSTYIHFQSDEELSSGENPVADNYFTSKPEHLGGRDLDPYFSVVGLHFSCSRREFTLVIDHKYRRQSRGICIN